MSIDVSNSEYSQSLQEVKEFKEHSRVNKLLDIDPEHYSCNFVESMLKREDVGGIETVYSGEFVDEESRSEAERILIKMAIENNPDMLKVFKYLGGDKGIDLAKSIESKYNLHVDNLEVAGYLYDFTYLIWSTTWMDFENQNDQNRVSVILPEIVNIASELGKYSVLATHQTQNEDNVKPIRLSQELGKSGPSDFEGAGVYVGILGGFSKWGVEEDTFYFKISLADTFPIITDRQDPQAMAVVLGDNLDIHLGVDAIATPEGVIKWNNDEFYSVNNLANEFQLTEIERVLKCRAVVEKIGKHDVAVVIDTELPPIVWASVARALHIGQVVTRKEFIKLGNVTRNK